MSAYHAAMAGKLNRADALLLAVISKEGWRRRDRYLNSEEWESLREIEVRLGGLIERVRTRHGQPREVSP